MKITDIKQAVRNPDRVNVSVDGKYRFSLDISQVTDLDVKIGREIDQAELDRLEEESQFGKLYSRALEYSFSRPHSIKEVRDYLWRKTLTKKISVEDKSKNATEKYKVIEKPGYTQSVADRVLQRLIDRGHLDDDKFSDWWVNNRSLSKGASRRKLQSELRTKGVDSRIIEQSLQTTERSDWDELLKVIAKKQHRYGDEQKFKQYLARQGFSFDDINQALNNQNQ